MDLHALSPDELSAFLMERVRTYGILSETDRTRILGQTLELVSRGMPAAFVLSSARSAARDLAAEAEVEAQPLDRERQRFIAENALPPEERIPAHRHPSKENKAREREEFLANARRLLKEARSSRQPYEKKKMRRLLMSVDLLHLRRSFGPEGSDLADGIQAALGQLSDQL